MCALPTRLRWSLLRTSRTLVFVSCSPLSTCCPKPPTGGWTPSSPPHTDGQLILKSSESCPSLWEPSPTTWSCAGPLRTRRLVQMLFSQQWGSVYWNNHGNEKSLRITCETRTVWYFPHVFPAKQLASCSSRSQIIILSLDSNFSFLTSCNYFEENQRHHSVSCVIAAE